MLSTLSKIFSGDDILTFFFYLFQKIRFDSSCTLSTMEKCHILFSGKIKKNIINLSSAEFVQRVVKVEG